MDLNYLGPGPLMETWLTTAPGVASLPGRGQHARDRSAFLSGIRLVVSNCESNVTKPGYVCVWGGAVTHDEFLHTDTQLCLSCVPVSLQAVSLYSGSFCCNMGTILLWVLLFKLHFLSLTSLCIPDSIVRILGMTVWCPQ